MTVLIVSQSRVNDREANFERNSIKPWRFSFCIHEFALQFFPRYRFKQLLHGNAISTCKSSINDKLDRNPMNKLLRIILWILCKIDNIPSNEFVQLNLNNIRKISAVLWHVYVVKNHVRKIAKKSYRPRYKGRNFHFIRKENIRSKNRVIFKLANCNENS